MSLELLPYQQALVDDRHPIKMVVHGRRVGATLAAAVRAVELESAALLGTLYIAPTQAAAELFGEVCQHHIEQTGARVRVQPNRDGRPLLLGEGLITCLGYQRHETIRSLCGRRCRVIVNQAAYIPDMVELYAAIAVMPDVLLLSDWADETPEKPNWFNSMAKNLKRSLVQGKSLSRVPREARSLHVMDFDRAICDGLYQRVCQVNGWEFSHERQWLWREELITLYGKQAGNALFCGMPESGLVSHLVPDLWQFETL